MKRPIGLYFVAVWCFLSFYWAIGGCTDRWGMPFLRIFPCTLCINECVFLVFKHIAALTVSLWLAVGLLSMNSGSRRGCLLLQGSYAILGVYVLVAILRDNAMVTMGAAIELAMILIMSPLSIWYLSRRSLREFARQFVEERQKQ